MKKIVLSASAALLSVAAFAGSYKITIGMPDVSLNNATAYLTSYDSGDTVATATVHGKRCVIKGKIEESYYARLIIDGKRCGMVVEDGEITVDWATKVASGAPLNDYVNKLDKQFESITTDEEAAVLFHQVYEENKSNGIGPWAYYNYLMCKEFTLPQIEAELKTVPSSYLQLSAFKARWPISRRRAKLQKA